MTLWCVYYHQVILPELFVLYEHGLTDGKEFTVFYQLLCG